MVYLHFIPSTTEADIFLQSVYELLMKGYVVNVKGLAVRGGEERHLHFKQIPIANTIYRLLREGFKICLYYTV